MSWEDMRAWIAHVLNHPIQSRMTVISMVGLVMVGAGLMLIVGSATERVMAIMWHRRRRGTDMEEARNAPLVDQATDADYEQAKSFMQNATSPTADAWLPVGGGWEDVGATDETINMEIAPEDSGVHSIPEPSRGVQVTCRECEGRGFYVKSVSDLLRESVELLGDSGKPMIKTFYNNMFSADPDLIDLFPADIMLEDNIHGQRDRLLKALVGLAEMYNPDDLEGMARLDTALAAFGRSHAIFARPDGSYYGATFAEYQAVKTVLFGVMHDVAGDAWLPAYDQVWVEAYDYAAVHMLFEQYRVVLAGEFTIPRQPRQ